MVVLALSLMLIISHTIGESAQEKQKCVEQLTTVATCLPYLGGSAKSPTSDCCSGLIQSIKNNKKCICIIIKDRDDPDLGLKINITLALGLPSLCKAPDNLSQCPCEFFHPIYLFGSFLFLQGLKMKFWIFTRTIYLINAILKCESSKNICFPILIVLLIFVLNYLNSTSALGS